MTIFSPKENVGDRYKIIKYKAAGGMQEVYIAYDNILKKRVALKTPKNQHAEKRFKRSAVLSARVNHPNVAKILDYFELDDRAVIIEELINGRSLDIELEDNYYYFDPHLLAQFGHHTSKGVAASHHAGVVHRDIKPGNIMIESSKGLFSFKITDFGIAILAEGELEEAHKDEKSITGSKTMMGAIPYMAPEMIESPKNAGCPSDIWAIGAILYKLMTSNHPFGVGLAAIPRIHEAKLPKKPDSFQLSQFISLNDELWDIISKCLQKDPAMRPSGDELVSMFGNICYGIFPRFEGHIKTYKSGSGNWGFIAEDNIDVFFHRESFYGKQSDIIKESRVQFAKHKGGGADRAHPVIPLKPIEL